MAEKGYGEIKARASIFPSDIDKSAYRLNSAYHKK